MGDVLNHAKGFVLASSSDDYAIEKENTIYNLFGDPSLSVAGGKVLKFTRVTGFIPKFDPGVIELRLISKSKATKPRFGIMNVVIQNPQTGEILARGVTNKEGVAKVKLPKNYKSNIEVTISGSNRATYSEVIKQ